MEKSNWKQFLAVVSGLGVQSGSRCPLRLRSVRKQIKIVQNVSLNGQSSEISDLQFYE